MTRKREDITGLTSVALPSGKLAEIIDYAEKHGLPSKLTGDDIQEIAAKLGIPTFVGDPMEVMRRNARPHGLFGSADKPMPCKQLRPKRATPKVMKLIDSTTGLMECRICGSRHRHSAMIRPGGNFYRGAWQCVNGCKPVPKD